MNKTIIINISGAIFHIEEDAYEILKVYMTDVKRHFGLSTDSIEIVTDIENRIAELFAEILKRESSQVIVTKDVQEVIAQMGKPADFDQGEEAESGKTGAEQPELAEADIKRKLFRDGDDKVLGGVSSGLAHYFDIDPVWVRVIWAVLFFAAGIGLIPYLVLWVAMPVAKTRAEKLSMKGEKVNLQTIRNSVSSELNDVRKNISKYTDEVKKSGIENRAGSFLRELFSITGSVLEVLLRLIVSIFGVIAVFAGGIALIAIFVCVVSFLSLGNSDEWVQFPLSIVSPEFRTGAIVSVGLFLLIPFFFLILLGIRILFKKTVLNTVLLQCLLVVWFICLCFTAYYGVRIGREFKEDVSINQQIIIHPPSRNGFYLRLDPTGNDLDSDLNESVGSKRHWNYSWNGNRSRMFDQIRLNIEKSDSSKAVLIEEFGARGSSEKAALKRADNIIYKFNQKDTVLNFPKNMYFNPESGYHEQRLNMTLKIPVNTQIRIDNEIGFVNLPDLDGYEFNNKPTNVWIMTNDGLKPKYGHFVKKKEENSDDESTNDTSNSMRKPERPEKPEQKERVEKPERTEKTGRNERSAHRQNSKTVITQEDSAGR